MLGANFVETALGEETIRSTARTLYRFRIIACTVSILWDADSVETKPHPTRLSSPCARPTRPLCVRYCASASAEVCSKAYKWCCLLVEQLRAGHCTLSLLYLVPGGPQFLFAPARGYGENTVSLSARKTSWLHKQEWVRNEVDVWRCQPYCVGPATAVFEAFQSHCSTLAVGSWPSASLSGRNLTTLCVLTRTFCDKNGLLCTAECGGDTRTRLHSGCSECSK